MSGKPGRSGGPRPNSGGARPGAGRPKKEPEPINVLGMFDDPEKFLRAVMNDAGADQKLRVDAAKALMPYTHARKGEGGKKDEAGAKAKAAGAGKFGASAPPRLVSNGGKKV